jgi:hypothetical protein
VTEIFVLYAQGRFPEAVFQFLFASSRAIIKIDPVPILSFSTKKQNTVTENDVKFYRSASGEPSTRAKLDAGQVAV